MLSFLLDFIFPRACIGCGRWENSYLCADCVNFLKPQDQSICAYCFKPAIGGQTHPSCQLKWGLDGFTAIFQYQSLVKKVIQQFKYQYQTDLGKTILEMILSFVGEDKAFVRFASQPKVALVPVPLHWLRKNWRGFNQAEVLGQLLAQKLGIKFWPDLLTRCKYTQPQAKLKKKQRLKNIKGCFDLNKQYDNRAIKECNHIIIFDDVWTTGATLKECALVLKRNGFKKVWALTLAR
jgi:competence protein ComFC